MYVCVCKWIDSARVKVCALHYDANPMIYDPRERAKANRQAANLLKAAPDRTVLVILAPAASYFRQASACARAPH